MILPNGVTEASMRAALTEFSAIVGNEWFFGPENERLPAGRSRSARIYDVECEFDMARP